MFGDVRMLVSLCLAVLLLASCAQAPTSSVAPSSVPAAASPSATAVANPSTAPSEPDASRSPSTTPTAGIVGADFATVLVNGLAVRSEPGVAATLVTCAPGADVRLDADTVIHVLSDPPAIDESSTWHRVVAPADDGQTQIGTPCDDVPFVVGWIATGTGEPFVSRDVECPALPTDVAQLAAVAAEPLVALACFESRTISVRASVVPRPDGGIGLSCPGIEPTWLTCGIDRITDGTSNVTIRIPPDLSMPVDGDAAIVVHVGDAAAESCASLAGDRYSPEAIATFCATQLVVVP